MAVNFEISGNPRLSRACDMSKPHNSLSGAIGTFQLSFLSFSFSLDRRITGKEALESRTSFRDWHPLWGIDGHIPKFWL